MLATINLDTQDEEAVALTLGPALLALIRDNPKLIGLPHRLNRGRPCDVTASPSNRDLRGEWRWRLKSPNGSILADSAEGYATKWNAKRAARRLRRSHA